MPVSQCSAECSHVAVERRRRKSLDAEGGLQLFELHSVVIVDGLIVADADAASGNVLLSDDL